MHLASTSLLVAVVTLGGSAWAQEPGTGYTICRTDPNDPATVFEGYICQNNYLTLAYCYEGEPLFLKNCACGAGCCAADGPEALDPGAFGECLCGEDNGNGEMPVQCTNTGGMGGMMGGMGGNGMSPVGEALNQDHGDSRDGGDLLGLGGLLKSVLDILRIGR